MNRVSTIDASTFCRRTLPGRSDRSNWPVWIVVEILLPNVEKMFPRRPIAAGTRTSSPGSSSSVPVIDPRTAPATSDVRLLRPSATRL
jgi:hypothetical protein